jgi:membrane-bound metal-dependent hydrolase YbcI (DUF457 family)
MDPVSHVVIAHCLNDLRQEATAPRGRALAIALGALSPDIDAVLMPAGWDRYLAAHEIGTHSILGSLVCGAGAAAVALLIRRRTSYRALLLPATIGSASHVMADLLSGASIRLAWPLADARLENIGVLAMGDPVIVAATVVAAAAMLVWQERRRLIATIALCVLALVTLEKTIVRERAELAYRAHAARGEAVGEYLVEPVWGSFTTWHLFDRTRHSVRKWSVDITGNVEPVLDIPATRGDESLIAASVEWDTVRNFRRAHDLAFAVATPSRVEWSDVRYCQPGATASEVQCGVWAGGEFSTAPTLRRLVVRVGDLVQVR